MDKIKCLECGESFIGFKELHHHLRSHKIIVQDYYHKHFCRKDLHTGELIEFKNREQYLSSFFNDQFSFEAFLSGGPYLERQKFIKDFLLSRKEIKGDIYAPCQAELRTMKMAPNIVSFKNAFGSNFYNKFCGDLGFVTKFKDFSSIKFYYDTINDASVCIDTREQKPFSFNLPTINKKLDYGDYKIYNDNGYSVYFERKSLSDLISTLTMGFDRFENEIVRANENNDYIIVVVESAIRNLLNFKNLKWVYSGHKITPDYVCHNLRALIQAHPNLQFIFAGSRSESVKIMEQIYCMANRFKETDLQLAFDLGFF